MKTSAASCGPSSSGSTLLLQTPAGDDHEGVTEQLEESAIRFEGNHPTVAAVIRSVVDTLTGYGI